MATKVAIIHTAIRWEEKAIMRALDRYGVSYVMFDPRKEPIELSGHERYVNDLFLQRSISRTLALTTSLLFDLMGYDIINRGFPTLVSQNKVLALATLSRAGVSVPRSYMIYGYDSARKAADRLGMPFVYKPSNGSWGRLIGLIRDHEDLRMISEFMDTLHDPFMRVSLAQQFIDKGDRDIRVTVVGDHAYAPIYRVNRDHWITNTARGSEAVVAELDPELEEISIKAAKAIGVEIAGIDIFEDRSGGYIVNEVNPVPEFKNVSRVTGVDIASLIAEYIVDRLKR